MSRRWKAERRRDPYRRMARRRGYRSRAAFKLKEMDKRFGLFKGARVVLDLGAAPGGWLQVASEAVGKRGLVIGVDLKPIRPLGLENVRTVVGDVDEEATMEEVKRLLPGPVDVLLSDLSPQISGAWDLDQFRQIELARAALRFAERFLSPDGWVVLKLFQGVDFQDFLRELRERLGFVKVFKPKASRKGSSEVYIVGRYLRRGKEAGDGG